MPEKKNSGRVATVAVAATIAAIGGAWAASSGSADPAPLPSAADVAATSPLVQLANEKTGAALGLDASRARPVDLSRAPSIADIGRYLLIPSAKGPCLLRTNQQQGQGTDEASKALVSLGSLSCGAGVAPTIAITPAGTIGAVSGSKDTVSVTQADGSTAPVQVDPNGVWFAPLGARKATVTSSGSTQTVDLTLQQ